jgi:hypothetical protein
MDFKITIDDKISKDLDKKIKELDLVPRQAYNFFKAETPIRSGRARKNTILRKDIIEARYPYAERLDNGYSKQAPNGMSKPTEAFIKQTVDRLIKRK